MWNEGYAQQVLHGIGVSVAHGQGQRRVSGRRLYIRGAARLQKGQYHTPIPSRSRQRQGIVPSLRASRETSGKASWGLLMAPVKATARFDSGFAIAASQAGIS